MSVNRTEIEDFISRFEERLAPAEEALGEAYWGLATTGTAEAQRELVRAGTAYNKLFAAPEEYGLVKGWYEGREALEGSLLRRQVEVLYLSFAGRQGDEATLALIEELEAEANAIFGNHRGKVGGEEVGDNEIKGILRSSEDSSLRREAWEASKGVGKKAEETVRELARLRNGLAREAGFPNHHAFSLHLQEIDPGELDGLMGDLEEATREPFAELKRRLDFRLRERFGIEHVMPWHLSDPFFQEAPEVPGLDVDRRFRGRKAEVLARATYDAMGLEVRDVLARSDLRERCGKSQHAFCLRVGRSYPYDVRVLANARDDAYWSNTMLHELGHAIYDKYIDPGLPYLLRSVAHTCTTEAVALMMGALSDEPAWLFHFTDASEKELTSDFDGLAERWRADKLVFVRWALVMYRFEKALYEEPDRENLNTLWWDLVEELQMVERPPGRDGEPDWAAKIHVATAPVYYHNYLLGHLTAAQLRRYIEDNVAGEPFYESELSGRYLQEALFGPGARDDWKTTALRATGEPLNLAYFVETLV